MSSARDRVNRIAKSRPSCGVDKTAKFDLTVIQTGGSTRTLSNVDYTYKVSEIKRLIRSDILNDPRATVKLVQCPNDNKTLGDYGFPKGTSSRCNYVTMSFEVIGGAAAAWGADEEKEKERAINFSKFPQLVESDKADCIMMCKKDGEQCAEMPCGCAISAQSMFLWMGAIFAKNFNSYVLTCPTEEHKHVEWDWDLCTEVANFSDEEYFKWSAERDRRILGKYRECPHCKTNVEKKGGVFIMRVNCGKCHGPDWCWQCAQKWNNTGLMVCGNKNCTLVLELNEQLAAAEEITLKYIDAKCPSLRACPRCLALITWTKNCKHMNCKGCGKKFCYSCLGLEQDGKWPCNGYDYKCPVAPRQNFSK